MKYLRNLFMVSILVLSVLLSGCINMEVNQQIERDGNSHIEVIYDMSGIIDMLESYSGRSASSLDSLGIDEDSEFAAQYAERQAESQARMDESLAQLKQNMTGMCDSLKEKSVWKHTKCRVTDDYRIIASGEIDVRQAGLLKIEEGIPYTKYKYNAAKVMDILPEDEDNEMFNSASLERTSGKMAKNMADMMGMEFTYTLTMPGKITKASVGEVDDDDKNTVVINMFDLYGEDALYVESKEMNLMWTVIIGGIYLLLLVAIVVLVVVLVKRRGGSRKRRRRLKKHYY